MSTVYYLETNALYHFSRHLVEDSAVAKAICYSSFLSVFEVLSGLTQDSYARRKAVLGNLFSSNVTVDWDTPREIMAESFGQVALVDKLKARIQRLARLTIQSTDYEALRREASRDKSAVALETLSEMDLMLSSQHAEQVHAQIVRMRNELSPDELQAIKDSVEADPSSERRVRAANRDTLLGRLAAFVAANMPGPTTAKTLLRVLRSYTGGIDRFLEAEALRQERNLLRAEVPAKNDFFDVSHILYLRRADQIVVTDDRFLTAISQELFPKNHCSVGTFRTLYGWT